MKKTIATMIMIAALATACGDNLPDLDHAREVIKEECGEAPLAPGWTVSFEQVNGFDRVLWSRDDYKRVEDWREAVSIYSACVQGYVVN